MNLTALLLLGRDVEEFPGENQDIFCIELKVDSIHVDVTEIWVREKSTWMNWIVDLNTGDFEHFYFLGSRHVVQTMKDSL